MLPLLVWASLVTYDHQAPLAKPNDSHRECFGVRPTPEQAERPGKLGSEICRKSGGLDRTKISKQLLQERNWGLKSFAGNAATIVVFILSLDAFRQAAKLEFVGV